MDHIIVTQPDRARLSALLSKPLEEELERALIVPADTVPSDVVTMNSRARYVDETTGQRRDVQVVYPNEADAARGRISVLSPVGSALLGLSVGQAIDWPFPGGETRRLRVESVLYQPETDEPVVDSERVGYERNNAPTQPAADRQSAAIEALLDVALAATFPASDALSITQPGGGRRRDSAQR